MIDIDFNAPVIKGLGVNYFCPVCHSVVLKSTTANKY